MIHRILRAFLMLMVILQSVIAVADVHQFHQQSFSYQILELDQSDNNPESVSTSASKDGTSGSIHPCAHCCHCHGMMPALSGLAPFLPDFDKTLSLSKHSFLNKSWLSSPDFRPPII